MINEFPIGIIDLRRNPKEKSKKTYKYEWFFRKKALEIEEKVYQFYLTINFDETEDIKSQCLDARNYLDSTRILVRNLLDKDENKYIKEYEKKFNWMLDNLGRVDKKIDELESETIDRLEIVETYNEKNLPNSPKIRRYINFLTKCMEHLVYYPLKKAWDYFKDEDVEGKDLFLYNVFIELYHSSESLGSISAEKIKVHPKHQEISSTKSSHESGEGMDSPEIVEFIKPKEILNEEQIEIQEEIKIRKREQDRKKIEKDIFE